ncbi:MAG TPA: hypothetical protein VMV73_02555 [Candidatus Dormibacteraeota bacterium]|nr:hypothetical protein [Candidatus Dormibacteraeota bacterium]
MSTTIGRTSSASESATLKVGENAPDFQLDSHLGEKFSLAGRRGVGPTVIAFFPFAFTGT